jgi:fatty-acyl-CoA synthase
MADETKNPWVDGLTIGQVLAETCSRQAEQQAIVFPHAGVIRTWREFGREVDATARALLALGIKKGEHVAVWATNVPQWVLLQFATAKIGAVMVTVNPAYRAHELKYVLNQSDSVALFLVDQFKSSDYFAMLAEVCPQIASAKEGVLQSPDYPRLRRIVAIKGSPPPGLLTWEKFLALGESVPASELDPLAAALKCSDAINIQYTSGTTGFPKAATLTHRNLLLNAFYIGECQNLSSADRICIPVPFYHCFGCVLGTLACAVYGATMIVPAEYFQPLATLDAIEKHRASSLYGVPTMFIAELQDPSLPGRNLKSLRTGIMAGAPCPIEVMKQVENVLGARELTIAYGQTEASPVVTQTRYDDPTELRVETVGRLIPGVEAKIIDPATGNSLPDNTQGEFCCRGHVVMLGYYKNPEATAAAIDKEGWLHSGDLAIRLPNGYYKITGRLKDMVIRGGENIYPREIEEFLFTHPAVEQAAVFGIPDAKYGEELAAWIKLKAGQQATADEIREFCKQKLAHYKVPRHVRLVDSFPQTVTGKIQKFRMRDIMKQELGLQEQATA